MIVEIFDWLSLGCPNGVPLHWLQDAWKRAVWQSIKNPAWGHFDNRFPWDTLYYTHDEYLVRRRAL